MCLLNSKVATREVVEEEEDVNGILQNGLDSGNNKPFWKYVEVPKTRNLVYLLLKVTAT